MKIPGGYEQDVIAGRSDIYQRIEAVTSKLLTTQEAADFLGMTYDNARKLLKKKYKPAQTIGRSNLWTRKQVEQAQRERA